MKHAAQIRNIVLILAMIAIASHASVTMQHNGSTDPLSEGWIGTSGSASGSPPRGDITMGPIDDNGTAAWFVDDSSAIPYGMYLYYYDMDAAHIVDGLNNGWSMDVTLRVVDIPDLADPSVLAAVWYNNRSFALHFGAQSDGDPIVRLGRNGPEYILEGTGGGYHEYSLVYDPSQNSADLFVNGVEVLSDYAGAYYSLSVNRFGWGSVSSYERGHGNYSALTFVMGGFPRPVIDITTPLNADNCVEATGPEGALVEAMVGNFNDDPSIVYHWSTSSGAMGTGSNFVFELGINEDDIIFLTAENTDTGETASSFKQVRVSDTTSPDITIISPEYGDTFSGNNLRLNVEVKDIADPDIKDYTVAVGSRATYPLNPETGMSCVKLFKPTPGAEPIPVDITVTAKDASGNASSATVQVMQQHDMRKK